MANDLSAYHDPISPDFLGKVSDGGERYRLTEAQVRFYQERGYLAGVPILTHHQIENLRRELSGLMRPDHDGRELWYEYHSNESGDPENVLFHSLGAWRIGPAFHDVLWHPAFTVAAQQLLEAAVRFWHDQLFCKPARHGGVVAWHQDYSYWTRTQPMAHLSCWIGLDDSTLENGCLQYVPGSHRWPLLEKTHLAQNAEAIANQLTPDQQEAFKHPVPVELPAGCATFHHPLMLHGSAENRSDRARRAMVLNVVADGVYSDTDDPLLEGVPPVPRGEKLSGRFFPLLRE